MKCSHVVIAITAMACYVLLSGCGSGANAVFGQNSRAEVKLTSRDISQLHLIVSPLQGSADASNACTDTASGFGCDRLLTIDTSTLTFTTNEDASTRPYYVYVRNTGSTTATATTQIRMDGDLKVDTTQDFAAGTTTRVARIFRNNADTH